MKRFKPLIFLPIISIGAILLSGIITLLALVPVFMTSGIRIGSTEPPQDEIIELTKKWINNDVTFTGNITTTKEPDYIAYFYEFQDERGIPFYVEVRDNHLRDFRDKPTPFFWGKYKCYSHYKMDIFSYYEQDILKIIEPLNPLNYERIGVELDYIRIDFSYEEDPEKIANALVEINELLSYNNQCSHSVTQESTNCEWSDYEAAGIEINFIWSEFPEKFKGYTSFRFGKYCNHCSLRDGMPYEKVYEKLSEEQQWGLKKIEEAKNSNQTP